MSEGSNSVELTGASALLGVMQQSGVEKIFSLSGNQIMALYDACVDVPVRLVHTRHEASAVFMAEAYAQLTGKPGVALVTAAPGFANALGAMYSAKMSETPVVLLSGDSPVAADGQPAFQTFPQNEAIAPFVKYAARPGSVSELVAAWQECVQRAVSGTPGPVHLALPSDVLESRILTTEVTTEVTTAVATEDIPEHFELAETDTFSYRATHESSSSLSAVNVQSLTHVIEQLVSAARPMVIVGPHLNSTRRPVELDEIGDRLHVPIICMESPRGLNDPSLGGFRVLCRNTDRILLLGKNPDFTLAYANKSVFPTARFSLISPDANNNVIDAEIAVSMSPSDAVNSFGKLMDDNYNCTADRSAWLEQVDKQLCWRPPVVDHGRTPLHPSAITERIANVLEHSSIDTVMSCDGGEFGQWSQAYLRKSPRIINGVSGAIGGSVPGVVGAALARPDSVIVAMLGDGTCGFYLSELETIAREKIPAVLIIGNDACWNAEYQIQLRQYGENRTYACEFPQTVRYDQVAQTLGLAGDYIESVEDLQRCLELALHRAQNTQQGSVLNVALERVPAPTFPIDQ